MQIVINIKEATYDAVCKRNMLPPDITDLMGATKNGASLPKRHGRLIDADELEECKEIMTTISGESKYAVRMNDIRNMSTIIQADKAEREEKE